jgi:hypothetical protein
MEFRRGYADPYYKKDGFTKKAVDPIFSIPYRHFIHGNAQPKHHCDMV